MVNTYELRGKICGKTLKKVLTNSSSYYIVVVTSNVKKSCKNDVVVKLKNRFAFAILFADRI